MMKLSTRGRYGVSAMYELALHYGQGPIALKTVAQQQHISESYLEQLISILRKAGLVKSIRGAQGGYELSSPPSAITVGDVVRALEGPIAPTECTMTGQGVSNCKRMDMCPTRSVWEKVRDSINEVLDSITLQQLCDEQSRR